MAYYSANHYIKYAIFPLTKDGVEYTDFDNCHRVYRSEGKHQFLLTLTDSHLPDAYGDLRLLLNYCTIARYDDYDVSPTVANKAIEALERIRNLCTTSKAKPGQKPKRKRKR